MIKCPYDKIAHHAIPENLPVNYSVLTALPMGAPPLEEDGVEVVADHKQGIRYCTVHPSKKVKFYCKNDR